MTRAELPLAGLESWARQKERLPAELGAPDSGRSLGAKKVGASKGRPQRREQIDCRANRRRSHAPQIARLRSYERAEWEWRRLADTEDWRLATREEEEERRAARVATWRRSSRRQRSGASLGRHQIGLTSHFLLALSRAPAVCGGPTKLAKVQAAHLDDHLQRRQSAFWATLCASDHSARAGALCSAGRPMQAID